MKIRALFFDFGGVLIEWNPRRIFERYFPGQPQALEQFLGEIGFFEWNHEQDKGRPFHQGVNLLMQSFPKYAHMLQDYQHRWEESIGGPIDGSIEILRRLHGMGLALYGLSNWSAETFPIIRRRHEFFGLFDQMIISGEVGLAKPDPAIFRLALQTASRPASECLFIDDSQENVDAARALGLHAIRFTTPEELQADLIPFNLPWRIL